MSTGKCNACLKNGGGVDEAQGECVEVRLGGSKAGGDISISSKQGDDNVSVEQESTIHADLS